MAEVAFSSDSILTVDFGTATTRVALLDVVEGLYRFVAAAEAPSTLGAPYRDASEGMRHALRQLQDITGRGFLDENAKLVLPATQDGFGVDSLVATASGGVLARAVLVGLLPDVSMELARRIAESGYTTVMDTINLTDRRREEKQIDAILNAKPHVIIMAGGTDGGASHALLQIADTVSTACFLLPGAKAHLLYVGNAELRDKITEKLGNATVVHFAPNIMPQLSEPMLAPARLELARVFDDLRVTRIGGFGEIAHWAGGRILPTAQTEAQFIRFLNNTAFGKRGVVGINLGSAATSVTAVFKDDVRSNVCADLGIGVHVEKLLTLSPLDQLKRWVPFEISDSELRDFVYTKGAYPHTLPADTRDLHLEYALARQIIRVALSKARHNWPLQWAGPRPEVLPTLDVIMAGGATFARGPQPGVTALLLLDALQPIGITRLLVDQYHLAAGLGGAAYLNPLAVSQIFGTGAFLELGTAVSLMGRARAGEVVCSGKVVDEAGTETAYEARAGEMTLVPFPVGRKGKLSLKPKAGVNAGFGAGRTHTLDVVGGAAGIVFDARGRLLNLPAAAEKRFELLKKWHTSVGGSA